MKKTIILFYLIFFSIVNFQIPVAQTKLRIFNGQILDKETKESIPFVTIIAKANKIYRVADENGFYKIPIKKNSDNILVEISSIGYKPYKTLLKNLSGKLFLIPNIEELDEIVISGYSSPKTILEKAIKNKKKNHPIKPFNFYRYGNILINTNDNTELNLELITKDCDYGYLSDYVISQRVEQIKWNDTKNIKKYKTSASFFSYRQNAIRYANILKKRKLKKFKLEFVKSNNSETNNYIIAFKTEKSNWKYTNKSYPTIYSGFVHINKENYAITKVVENWTSALTYEEVQKYFGNSKLNKSTFTNQNKPSKIIIKEENICDYSNILNDNKYYATKYFNRVINEVIDTENNKNISTYERDSYLFDFKTKNVEEIEYYEYNNKKENSLHRVKYNENYWNSFYKKNELKHPKT